MTTLVHPVEVMHETDTQPEAQNVSALVRAGLAEFIYYPDLEHTLKGIDSETSLAVEANLTVSLGHEYTCKTCEGAIAVEERHVVIGGVYSYRKRTNDIFDHHHLHSDCFSKHELLFWSDIVVAPMNKQRRDIILSRIRQAKARRKTSSLAA